MPQFLIPPGKKAGDVVALSAEESRHLARVLRAAPGDAVRLTDGAGSLFYGSVVSVSPRGVTARIESASVAKTPNGRLILAQGLLKGEKMEFVIQKAAELGAAEILPFTSSRTVAFWKKDPRKLQRWRKIAEAASKQSGRATHLTVRDPVPFEEALKTRAETRIVFWEEAESLLRNFIRRDVRPEAAPSGIAVLVGPEGGFSRDEIALAAASGFSVLSMGPLILRAETAAVAALSILQYELGNL
jgi:16S rRNA (uracil1498-N3)-methyltransferase